MQEIRDRDISATVSSYIEGLKGLPRKRISIPPLLVPALALFCPS